MPAISFLPFLQTVPFGTRVLTLALVVCSLGAFIIRSLAERHPTATGPIPYSAFPWLVLVPGSSLIYPWTFLISGWIEINPIEFIVSVVTLPLAARYLERVWGARELFKFCAITVVGTNIIAFGFSWLAYFVTGQDSMFLYGSPYRGLTALQTGFLVAFTQLIPEHQVQLFGALKMRVKSLPGVYLLISNVLTIILGPSPYILIQFGFFVAWAYLRFFKLSENGEFRGDRSETFAFANWFPPVIRKYVAVLANHVFALAVRFKVVQPWDDATTGGNYGMLPGPGASRAEAERRRAVALKALDARMASAPIATASTSAAAVPPAASVPVPAEVKKDVATALDDVKGKGKDVVV